ncbi:MAG: thioredoxin family protein [Oligoflexales bacterium]
MKDMTPDDLKLRLDAGADIFLKIWKTGCGPCKLSVPALERLEAQDESEREWLQVNAADYPEMLEVSGSEVLPAFFVFKKGKKISQTVGFKGLAKLKSFIEEADTET